MSLSYRRAAACARHPASPRRAATARAASSAWIGVEPHVVADVLVVVLHLRAMNAERAKLLVDVRIVRGDQPGVAERTEVLRRVEAHRRDDPERTAAAAAVLAAERLGRVFDHVAAGDPRRSPRSASMSQHWPNRWTGMTALVRGVTFASIWLGSMLNVSGSMSAKTGVAPTRQTAPAVAKNVNGGMMTSSPGPIAQARAGRARGHRSRSRSRRRTPPRRTPRPPSRTRPLPARESPARRRARAAPRHRSAALRKLVLGR